ncbi:Hypothetical predicted protein [Octopus vulgaris]|uniref:Uncharacterized protein n=1 Tax=Octopus vulgaris TaxID=6645 RepID=A0AA36AX36_OCTVU|nr:Hypothetical predicted protein [Octopus vulgaris]
MGNIEDYLNLAKEVRMNLLFFISAYFCGFVERVAMIDGSKEDKTKSKLKENMIMDRKRFSFVQILERNIFGSLLC